ncbi:hypothetical protein RIVM261_068410 [Rivularia sp. IAM M-261]|nr:hypothetical protein CAL7716_040850 [Calothrix sp. PCC 7716]GJD21885.1 hypothetical protein RIVM261_068410 [Rivularia sp. IAM M-261]
MPAPQELIVYLEFGMKLFRLALLSIIFGGISTATVANAQLINNPRAFNGSGNSLNYPTGTRILPNGTISAPNGITYPSVTVPRGNGATTYYYPNGTNITIQGNQTNPTGTYLRPGANGGLTNNIYLNPQYFPNGANLR